MSLSSALSYLVWYALRERALHVPPNPHAHQPPPETAIWILLFTYINAACGRRALRRGPARAERLRATEDVT
eukprot:931790-Prymnesium_polylepis.1